MRHKGTDCLALKALAALRHYFAALTNNVLFVMQDKLLWEIIGIISFGLFLWKEHV